MTNQHRRSYLTQVAGRIGFPVAALLWAAALIAAETPSPRRAWTTSRVAGSPHPPPQYRLAPAFSRLKFDHPTSLTELPKDDRLLLTEIGGKIFTFARHADVAKADLAIDLVKLLPEEFAQERNGAVERHAASQVRREQTRICLLSIVRRRRTQSGFAIHALRCSPAAYRPRE